MIEKVHFACIWRVLNACSVMTFIICDRLQENRAQRGPDEKFFFCTYTLLGKQILSFPNFIAVALAIPATYHLTVPFVRLI